MHRKLATNFYHGFIQIGIIIILIFLTSFYSYTLFHSLAELMSVIISFGVYMLAWNSRHFVSNKYFIFLGVALFCVATLDLLHTFAYKGIDVFTYTGSDLATQFWIAARYFQSISFLLAAFFIGKNIKTLRLFLIYMVATAALLASILWWHVFPTAYIEGSGPTLFKKGSEIVICLLYVAAIFLLHKRREAFNRQVYKLLVWALAISILSEIMFIVYVGAYDNFNMIGHILKIISFSFIYIAFIETGLRKPYAILFKELKDSEVNHRRSEQKFRAIFNNATVGMLMTHMDSRIIETNKRFADKMGYLKEELLNLKLSLLTDSYDSILKMDEFQKVQAGKLEYCRFENTYQKRNGQTLWGDTSVSLIKDEDEKPQYILWVVRDITETKEIDKIKIEFVSLASHQLRTPLTSVRLATELLLREPGSIDHKQLKYLQEINSSSRRMSTMIKDLLNISRIELGTLVVKPEPINVVNNINQIIEELSLQINAKKLKIAKDYHSDLPYINFDRQIFRIIFENLLANSICYTPIGGEIEVKVAADDEGIFLSISDTGCGIPDFEQNQIFNKLFRADNAKQININGTGLGLYIVKSLAEKTGAKVWFESEEGKGTTFHVSIPNQ